MRRRAVTYFDPEKVDRDIAWLKMMVRMLAIGGIGLAAMLIFLIYSICGGLDMTWNLYLKKAPQEMRPYVVGEDLSGISVNAEDIPGEGGMVARNSNNHADRWYVAKQFFEDNYIPFDCEAVEDGPHSKEDVSNVHERVLDEYNEIKERLSRLESFMCYGEEFAELSEGERGRLRVQAWIMRGYRDILKERLQGGIG
jgi:hypothetical protein